MSITSNMFVLLTLSNRRIKSLLRLQQMYKLCWKEEKIVKTKNNKKEKIKQGDAELKRDYKAHEIVPEEKEVQENGEKRY